MRLLHYHVILVSTIALLSVVEAWIISHSSRFGRTSLISTDGGVRSKTTLLCGVLSRSDILRASQKKRRPQSSQSHDDVPPSAIAVVEEAMARQEQIRHNLESERNKSVMVGSSSAEDPNRVAEKESQRQAAVRQRLAEVDITSKQLLKLKQHLVKSSSHQRDAVELSVRLKLAEMGFETLLQQSSQTNWISKQTEKEFGRPSGFSGLVFASPNGVPILVGKMGAHADETLRRVAQGSDLWFQVEGYDGSRVLLRTSLCRGYKGSKACIQMAADLASYYSTSRWEPSVDVMYTDSKHVAKRGSKTGQLRKRKTFGSIVARPASVQEMAKGKEP